MTIRSLPWETVRGIGDGAFVYTQEDMHNMHRYFDVIDPATMGVVARNGGELAVSGTTGAALAVATGKAYVNGQRYRNTSSVATAVSTPAADTGFLIKLRANYSALTLTAVSARSGSGNTSIPSLTQNSSFWDIPLAEGIIDSSGDVWTDTSKTVAGVTDRRHFAVSPLASMVRLRTFEPNSDTGSVTFSFIQQSLTHLMLIGYGRLASGNEQIRMYFNGDTTAANYIGLRSSISSGGGNQVDFENPPASGDVGRIGTFGSSGSVRDAFRVLIPFYANTDYNKVALSVAGSFNNLVSAMAAYQAAVWWEDTGAIESITLTPDNSTDFDADNCKIELYGII